MTDESIIGPDDQVHKWWFFSPRTPDTARKVKRSTPSGYWKKTGIDRKVKARDTDREIGSKKTLVFHGGRGKKGVKTNWVIHEYHLLPNDVLNLFLILLKFTRYMNFDNISCEKYSYNNMQKHSFKSFHES